MWQTNRNVVAAAAYSNPGNQSHWKRPAIVNAINFRLAGKTLCFSRKGTLLIDASKFLRDSCEHRDPRPTSYSEQELQVFAPTRATRDYATGRQTHLAKHERPN